MGLYQVTDNSLKRLEAASFATSGIWERRDLQQWLIANISALGDDLLVISEEFGDFEGSKRRIDILAVDKDANLVVIELKRTEDGGHMDLQAIRYAAMVANMTWERAVTAFQTHLGERTEGDPAETDAEKALLKFLGWKESQPDDFAQSIKIILASADFSTEITATVLWLNEVGLDIKCIRLSLHKLDDNLILSADQIIPLPEAEEFLIQEKQKKQEERISKLSRDKSTYSIFYDGEVYQEGFRKADIGYHTVRLLNDKGLINHEIFEFLRADRCCSFQLLKLPDEMTEGEKKYTRYRFQKEAGLIYKNQGYYVARNWNATNAPKFIDKINQKFPKVTFDIEVN